MIRVSVGAGLTHLLAGSCSPSSPPPPVSNADFITDYGKRFPNIFCLAMDVLPAQVSSVPCKCLFSSGKETCTPHRNRIDPKLMEVLQALKLSSHNCSLNLTEHLSARFYSLEGDDLEISEVFKEVYNTEGASSHMMLNPQFHLFGI